MTPARLSRLALLASLAGGCSSPVEPGTTLPIEPKVPGYGAVNGAIRGSGSGYPVNGNGSTGGSTWPVSIDASGPAQSQPFGRNVRPDFFEFTGLAAGTWTIRFMGMNPWPGIFPAMRLYYDTAITVTVLPNQTVTVPEVVLRPVDPFIVIAIESCPWGFSGAPTIQDWGDCDGGYWGGLDVAVEVRGIAGTATAGVRHSFVIPKDRWNAELRGVQLGEYEVDVVPAETRWRLLPWQSSPARILVDRGLAYVELDYWFER